ncbi:Radical SAM domain heme biosynthesis protein [Minicystis rosea]|nr:Radical SAM domain heme biosynthesis protein [Minicystis rosea]
MQTTRGQFHPTRFDDIAVTIDFHCNSACKFCIVQEGMNHYKGLPFDRFQQLVDENRVSGKYGRVIFTGGEVTLEKSLPAYARYARDSGAFAYIRLQTNARKLADEAYARSLVEVGINEFFVSLHGADATVQDGISQRPGSFDEAIRGMKNLRALGVRLITNTVITRENVTDLPRIADLAGSLGAERMELWNYLPMEDHADERDLIAPLADVMPSLVLALDRCRAQGIEAITKYVPRCLLGEHQEALDNSQADVIIVESFWNEFPRFNCLYEAKCEHSDACLGLSHDYVNKHGWEETRLRPAPRTTPWEERQAPARGKPEEYGERPEHGSSLFPAWEALTADIPPEVGRVEGVELSRNQARFKLRAPSGATVVLVLGARDEATRALARTASFNVFYNSIEGRHEPGEIERLLAAAVERIRARDRGQLTLDARKGLVELRRPSRKRA